MPIAPFEMAPWTAVDVRDGFVSSSTTERLIFLPFDPALSVLQVNHASHPCWELPYLVAAGPVREEM